MYHAMVYSTLRYGILVWGGTNKTTLRQVEIIKKSTKIIHNKPRRYSTELLFQETNHLSVKETFALKATIFLSSKGIEMEPETAIKTKTRQTTNQHVRIPVRKKSIGQRTIEHLGLKLINAMPTELRIKLLTYEQKKKATITRQIISWFKTININILMKN